MCRETILFPRRYKILFLTWGFLTPFADLVNYYFMVFVILLWGVIVFFFFNNKYFVYTVMYYVFGAILGIVVVSTIQYLT